MLLNTLGKKYKTDKSDLNHSFENLSYLDIYEKYFYEIKNNNIILLEIGVRNGHSLKVWKEYFNNSKIYGIDIDPACKKYEEENVEIFIGSQDSYDISKNFNDKSIDVIIDDGSHINTLTIKSFELFFPKLRSGGIYIIEDLRNSYKNLQSDHNIRETWPGMKYNKESVILDNNRTVLNTFFFDLIKKLDFHKGSILSIHFWAMICIIIKI